MHSKTDFNVKSTGVCVTEGIGFNMLSLHEAQAKKTIIMGKDDVQLFDKLHHVYMRPEWTRPPLRDLLLCLPCLTFHSPSFLRSLYPAFHFPLPHIA